MSKNDRKKPMNDKIYKKLFSSLPEVDCGRVLLRPYRESDAKDFNEYMREDRAAEYLMWYPHLNLHETKGYVEFMLRNYRKCLPSDWAVVLKENGKVIGNCGFTSVEMKHECAELGYVLSPSYWGRGLMDEAMKGVMAVCFEQLEAHRAILRIVDENIHSKALAERLGFRLEGRMFNSFFMKGGYRTICVYAMLEQEYAERIASCAK